MRHQAAAEPTADQKKSRGSYKKNLPIFARPQLFQSALIGRSGFVGGFFVGPDKPKAAFVCLKLSASHR